MAQLIEPITIMVGNEEKVGCILMTYQAYPNRLKADILDKDGNVLFRTILTATNVSEVAQQLNLTLKTNTVDNTKELVTEIMEADAKDGLYKQQTDLPLFPETKQFENVEWVFQFDDDEPKPFPSALDDTKKLVIEINNTSESNICFYDGNGKTFKIFAREKQIVNTMNLEPNGTNHLGLDTNNLK